MLWTSNLLLLIAVIVSCLFQPINSFSPLRQPTIKSKTRTSNPQVVAVQAPPSSQMTQRVSRIGKKTDSKQEQEIKTEGEEEIEKEWRLILHDDTIHTIEEVVEIIATCVPLCPGPRAYDVTMEVHLTGAATVCTSNKKMIEEYAKTLQAAGLTVSCMQDDDFQGGEGGEEEGDVVPEEGS
eukprot:gene17691-20408_t